jgi:hypothetical protein
MRNRGVEVFMSGGEDDDSVRDAGKSSESSENSSALDVKGQSVFEDDPSSQTLTNVDDLEGVLAAAGVPAGAPRRAMARAHRALVNGDVLESSDLSPESISSETDEAFRKRLANARASVAARFSNLTHREASRWAALTSELLARGVGAENALRVAWTHVYARGEVSSDARRATRRAFATHVKPFLDAMRRDFSETENVVDKSSSVANWARSTLVEPLGWPEPAATSGSPPADVESRARRAGALLETVAGTLYGRERAAADALSATAFGGDGVDLDTETNGRSTEKRVSALALAAFPLRALRRRLALDRSASARKRRASDENANVNAFPDRDRSRTTEPVRSTRPRKRRIRFFTCFARRATRFSAASRTALQRVCLARRSSTPPPGSGGWRAASRRRRIRHRRVPRRFRHPPCPIATRSARAPSYKRWRARRKRSRRTR